MSLLNVRLTKADEEAVRILKRLRVKISGVVRAALHREADKHRPRSAASTAKLLAEIFDEYPELAHDASRGFEAHDRRAFAEAFREHVRGRRAGRRE
jgi:predicted component of type VI protein secretion system